MARERHGARALGRTATDLGQGSWPVMVVIAVVGAVGVFLLWRIDHPLGVRADSWSEAQVVISGWNYARDGFTSYAGLPQYQVGPPADPYFMYSSYPPLSNLLYGMLHVAGVDARGMHRLPAIAASLIALWVWFTLVAAVADRATAAFATVGLGTSFAFLAYADNIHVQAYPLPLQLAAVLCCARAVVEKGAAARWWVAGALVCAFAVSLITVEQHFWLPIASAGIGWPLGRGVRWRLGVAVAAAMALGLTLQWAQGRLGSPVPLEERPSLVQSLHRRSIGFDEAVDTPRDAAGRRLRVAAYPYHLATRLEGFYRMPLAVLALLPALAVMAVRARASRGKRWPPACSLLGVFFVAGLAWLVIMMQQSAVHPAALRQLLPCYALTLGMLWAEGLRIFWSRQMGTLLGAVVVAAALISAGLHARRGWDEVKAYASPTPTPLSDLGRLPANVVVLTNDHMVPLVRYWARRPTYWVPNALPRRGERTYMDLTLSYLRKLHGGRLPRLVYVYTFRDGSMAGVAAALETDSLLRLLVSGHTRRAADPVERGHALRALLEAGSHCPILLRGPTWVAFDMSPVTETIMRLYAGHGTPAIRDMPPPV